MKNLHFDYCMEISYSVDVTKCCYTIKCIPRDSERQKITNYQIEMVPQSRPEWAFDSLGNRYIFGCNEQPHSYFKYRIYGDVECGINNFEGYTTENEEMIYRHWHGMTVPGQELISYQKTLNNKIKNFDKLSPFEKAKEMMACLYEDFSYEKGCTQVDTSAEEAFVLKKGVCQDYAHILISLLILSGCSARYVTGLIVGEGESHAWVEVASEGKWYGVDPTNNIVVSDSHIKIGVGREASECQINRGIMHGGGDQKQMIAVSVMAVSPGQKYLRKGALL